MAFGAILGQRPGVQSVNNVLPDVQGNVTLDAENVGAAPAGYGLGEDSSKSVGTWNAANQNGFYYSGLGGPDSNGYYGVVVSGQYSVNEYAQLVWNSGNGAMAVRHYRRNAYTPWEYITPPMATGVEYRTTERYNNLPVYTAIIDGGAIPSTNSQKFIKHNKAANQIVRYSISTNAYGTAVPGFSFGGSVSQDVSIYGGANQNGVFLAVKNLNWTQFKWWAQIWYTK